MHRLTDRIPVFAEVYRPPTHCARVGSWQRTTKLGTIAPSVGYDLQVPVLRAIAQEYGSPLVRVVGIAADFDRPIIMHIHDEPSVPSIAAPERAD